MSQPRGPTPFTDTGAQPGGLGRRADGCQWWVGIGASAGGLEALEEFFGHVCLDNICVIIVQHMLRGHSSLLPQLLARNRQRHIVIAEDGVSTAERTVLVSPADVYLELDGGVVRHRRAATDGSLRFPIDHFFASLANDQGARALGVILSGSGTDGTQGLAAIRAGGGVTFAQAPATARYAGMPSSALNSGYVDYAWAPRDIAAKVSELALRPCERGEQASAHGHPEPLQQLIAEIREKTGTDLGHYKQATLDRRIQRRMTMQRMDSVEAYIRRARANADEMEALYHDLLISVTYFFRDPDVFEILSRKILPEVIDGNLSKASRGLRIWVPACASGEEAYSFAILVLELLERRDATMRVQIFATDVDARSIARARSGFFGAHIRESVTPDRLTRFFTARDGGYQVCRRLRDLVVFSPHDLLRDAPFSRMDLVSCRNLLIYLRPAAQKRVLSTLHYALSPSGVLLLGPSESVGEVPELFAVEDAKAKVYLRKRGGGRSPQQLSQISYPPALAVSSATPRRPESLRSAIERCLLNAYAPCGALVDPHYDVIQFTGDIGAFLAPVAGPASFNLLRLIRFEFHVEVKRALDRAGAERRCVRTTVTQHDEGRLRRVTIDVMPMTDPRSGQECLLVLFLPDSAAPQAAVSGDATSGEDRAKVVAPAEVESNHLHRLAEELRTTKHHLRDVVEEAEAARESFKIANEELQSSNEELQSTNEELETSKEELQSANEELTTVNEELHGRMVELGQINDDLHNFLTVVESVFLAVDLRLSIRRWTVAAEKTLGLGPDNHDRHLSCLEGELGCRRLADKASAVIDSLSVYRERVKIRSGDVLELIISPYKTLDYAVRGAIVRLVPLRCGVRIDLDSVLAKVVQPVCAVDGDLRLAWANPAFFRRCGVSRRAGLNRELGSLGAFASLTHPDLVRLRRAARGGRQTSPLTLRTGGRAWRLRGSPLQDGRRGPLLLLSIEVDDGS